MYAASPGRFDGSDGDILGELCDFNVLMALGKSMRREDMSLLCKFVKKFSRGQRKGIEMNKDLKIVLKSLLES